MKDGLFFEVEKLGETTRFEYFVKYSPHKISLNQIG